MAWAGLDGAGEGGGDGGMAVPTQGLSRSTATGHLGAGWTGKAVGVRHLHTGAPLLTAALSHGGEGGVEGASSEGVSTLVRSWGGTSIP